MNTTTKPITYISLKSVLTYMDPSLRLRLSSAYPPIHRIDRIVPLKIENLAIKPLELKINNTVFKIDFIKKSEVGDESIWEEVTNSDSIRKKQNSKVIYMKDNKDLPSNGPQDSLNADFIRFATSSPGFEKFEFLSGTHQNVFRMMGYLMDKFFGEGRKIVHVRHLTIDPSGALIIPSSIKFEIQELEINSAASEVLEGLPSVLDISSFPLKSLWIHGPLPIGDPIFETAQKLVLFGPVDVAFEIQMISLKHKRVHFIGGTAFVILALIFYPDGVQKEIDTYFSLEFEEGNGITKCIITGYLETLRIHPILAQKNRNISRTEFPYRVINFYNEISDVHFDLKHDNKGTWTFSAEICPIE